MITDKDRSQLLRMAGNIAGGMMIKADWSALRIEDISMDSAKIALATMKAVDKLIQEEGK